MENTLRIWFRKKIDLLCHNLEESILSDKTLKCKVVFGPVHSRRLGNVIGINNIKQKACPYDCVYCTAGRTTCCSICTDYCLSPYQLHLSVRKKLEEIQNRDIKIDYMVFTGIGEPTLDLSLSKEILLLREFGYKIAVFTNGSLLWRDDVRENLMFADYVSVKIDTVNSETWMKMNRPHRKLDYELILKGIKQFSKCYRGKLTTETMLIKGINDSKMEIENLSEYLNNLQRSVSYFMTPLYPPSEIYAVSPEREELNFIHKLIKEKIRNAVLLCCPEKQEFIATNDLENELLGLLSLHPVSIEAVKSFTQNKDDSGILENLITTGRIKQVSYNDKIYLVENIVGSLN